MEQRTDNELIAAYLQGEKAAFEALVRRHLDLAYRIALRYMRNASEAEDAAQDVFIKVWKHLKRFDPAQNFPAWLTRIARNTALDALKKKKPFSLSRLFRTEEAVERFEATLADPAPQPPEAYAKQEQAEVVNIALASLGEKERAVITLYYHSELTLAEIAARLGEPLNTIKSRHQRSLKSLRTRLDGAPNRPSSS